MGTGFSQTADAAWSWIQEREGQCVAQWEAQPQFVSEMQPPFSTKGSILCRHFVSGGTGCNSHTEVNFPDGSVFGPPLPLRSIPDGTEILAAKAEINCEGLTRSQTITEDALQDCDGNVITPYSETTSTATTGLVYRVVGWTAAGRTSWEEIGTITGAGNGQKVVDVTTIMQRMFAERATGLFAYGYGILVLPEDVGFDSGIGSLLVGEGPRRAMGCPPDNTGVTCPLPTQEYYKGIVDYVEWDSLVIKSGAIKIRYPSTEPCSQLYPPIP